MLVRTRLSPFAGGDVSTVVPDDAEPFAFLALQIDILKIHELLAVVGVSGIAVEQLVGEAMHLLAERRTANRTKTILLGDVFDFYGYVRHGSVVM